MKKNNFIQNDTWVELIGIWGSGKSTAINYLKNDLKEKVYFKTTNDFFKLNKLTRSSMNFFNLLRTPIYSFELLKIFFPKIINGLFLKDEIFISELRSFWYCYSARLFELFNKGNAAYLWEGEFHLIPFLNLEFNQKENLITLLLNLSKKKLIKFIVLDTPIEVAINRIEKDQVTGKKIRFSKSQYKIFKNYINKILLNQEELIKILEKKGAKVYKIKNLEEITFKKIFLHN
tara:strand:- start:23939 stop:24634 length:696 start_codon:yes stop_codon:yes gene_type:complete